VQSTLLALLSQAANAAGGTSQIPPNIGTNPAVAQVAQLDVNQLALIQQLAQTSQLGSGDAAQSPSLPLHSAFTGPSQGANAHPPHTFRPPDRVDRDYDRRGLRNDPYNGPRRSRSPRDYHDDRRDFRGGYRGSYRGRGRGRGMDDRDRFRDRERDWRSPPHGRGSRSHSPPGSRYGKDRQPHSPPRQPPLRQPPYDTEGSRSGGPTGDRDEFGRDIRPQSSRDAGTASASHDEIDMQSQTALTSVAPSLEPSSPTVGDNEASLSQPQSYPKRADVGSSEVGIKDKGLDDYDFSTFDPTLPSAWEALGKAWQITHGYQPSTEEIMQLVMTKAMGQMGSMGAHMGMEEQWGQGDWQQSANSGRRESWSTSTATQWPSGNGSAGGHSYGDVRGQDDRNHGGQTAEQDKDVMEAGEVAEEPLKGSTDDGDDGSVNGRGRMQKVGDRWIFVKGSGAT